jgi:hypothetical protein
MWLMLAAIGKIASSERTELRYAAKKWTAPDFCTPDKKSMQVYGSKKSPVLLLHGAIACGESFGDS